MAIALATTAAAFVPAVPAARALVGRPAALKASYNRADDLLQKLEKKKSKETAKAKAKADKPFEYKEPS